MKQVVMIAIILVGALGLSACGKKGDVQPPSQGSTIQHMSAD